MGCICLKSYQLNLNCVEEMSEISIVDLEKVSLCCENPSYEDYEALSRQIKESFETIGFMYITNHGIPQDIIENAMKSSMDFFDLDRSAKNLTRKGEEYQGWVEQGREIFDQDEEGNIAELEVRETYDLKNVSSSGIFPDEVSCLIMHGGVTINLINIPSFHQNCPQLRGSLSRLAECSKELARRLLRSLSVSLGRELGFLDNLHLGMVAQGSMDQVENSTTLRSIHYPPISDKMAQNPKIIRYIFLQLLVLIYINCCES